MAGWNAFCNWMMDNEEQPRVPAQIPEACPGGVAGPRHAITGISSDA